MKKIIFCFIFLLQTIDAKTICLNMIVKDETKVIKRCLDSVRPIIDYWVIVDTGSTDGTQEMIKEHMKDIPGELLERPWKNFGYNRNEALQFAKDKADYILFIDADEVLVYENDFKLPNLDKDLYYIMTHFGGTNYARAQIIKNSLNWQWKGVLHEYLDCPEAKTNDILANVYNEVHTDGARSQDPQKYLKDVETLKAGLRDEPNNLRYLFYLAQSYKDANDYENSLKWYKNYISVGLWDEEIYWAKLQVALLEQLLDKPPEQFLASFNQAYDYRPTRIEPLYHLALYYRTQNNYSLGYAIASKAIKFPPTKDILFVQQWMYDYGIPLELSICAYWLEKYDECAQLSRQLLARPDLPNNIRDCVKRNLAFAEIAMKWTGIGQLD